MRGLNSILIGTVIIFALTYYGIISKNIHRTTAAMAGAVGMILFGHFKNFYPPENALGYIDFNTIGLILGLMILHGLLGETGFIKYAAIKTAKLSKGSYYRLLALFVVITAFTSAFLDNVTTVLLVVPVAVTIANELDINPIPFLMVVMISSNIGGTSTLIGDPPNVMIASAAQIRFVDYLIYLAPIVLIILGIMILIFELLYKNILESDMTGFKKVMELDERKCITNRPLLYKSLFVLILTMILFMTHHLLGLEPWIIALMGASLLLLISLSEPEDAMQYVNWTTLIFFAGLFILIGGLVEAGIINVIADQMLHLSSNNLALSIFIVLIVSGVFAMIVGNIPAVITLIPVVQIVGNTIGTAYPINPLWWALALGIGLGGNGTIFSSPSNLIVTNISEKMGYPISFRKHLRFGLPITLFTLLLSFFLLYGFYVVLLKP